MIPITGLWSGKDKNGNLYLSGYMGNAKLVIFKNKFKEDGDNKPSYIAYVDKKADKKEEGQTQQSQAPASPESEDDLPF